MRASRHATTMLVLFAAGTLAMSTHGSQQAATKKPSNTWQMRCVIQATADSDVLPLTFALVESLLRSDAVAGEAARTTWPKGHGVHDATFDIQLMEDPGFASPETVGPRPPETQTVLFGLQVHLDNEVGPVAREFGNALIGNLRAELQKVFAARNEELKKQLTEAETQRQAIRTEFEDMVRRNTFASPQPIQQDPADEAIYKQLQTVVDLSAIRQQTPATEAFEILRNSVQPPLNLIVIWRDVSDNANVEPSSPVQMDGPASIQLGTALQNLLAGLTDPLASSHDYCVDYMVNGGAITVATRLGLPAKKVETRVYDLPPLLRMGNQAAELAALIREIIEPESWHDLYLGSGIGTITPSPDGKLIVSQSRDVHIRIQQLLAKMTTEVSLTLPGETSQETLDERLEFLLGYREQLEQELDRLQDRQGQLAREEIKGRMQAMATAFLEAGSTLHTATEELRQLHQDMTKAKPDAPQNAKLQRAIQTLERCTNRFKEASPPIHDLGGEVILVHGDGKETVAERIAAKQSDLREVSRRIAETQRMMAGSKTFDPELSRIEWTARRCEQADARIHDLKTRLANLRPCAVTVIGGIE